MFLSDKAILSLLKKDVQGFLAHPFCLQGEILIFSNSSK